MTNTIKFEKVSFNQFYNDCKFLKDYILTEDTSNDMFKMYLKKIYDNIKLPHRGTKQSAGYDFMLPFNVNLNPGDTILIPTGIRCKMPESTNIVLMIFPRSGLGSKYRFVPCNLTGIIDADYYNADNEGHIMMKMANDGKNDFFLASGSNFCQGVFLPYYTTSDDCVDTTRTGGFGSTDKE
jgi:dUTP pyrophosphatase